MFLSGGIDSATILTLMARLNTSPVLAFTAGFDSPRAADERAQAAEVARALGARHETLEVTEAMVWRHLPEIVTCMDDPAADYAMIPTWFLARRARQDVKVVLSGEGGDEMFAGYGRYRSAMRPWWLGGRVMRGRGTFDRLDVLRARPAAWRDGLAAAEAQAAAGGRSRLQVAQAIDIADWLPHDLLLKLDRCLMAHAVEGRTPFVDPGVAAAAFRLPDALKVQGQLGKWLLRRWLEKNCPAARPFAPKQGFTVPVGAWIGGVGARLGPLVAAQPGDCRGGRCGSRDRAVPPRRRPARAVRRLASAVLRALAPRPYRGSRADWRRVRVSGSEVTAMTEHFSLLIRNGTAVLPWGEAAADIGVRHGRIAAIGAPAAATADETFDACGLHVLPGLIDPHVHLRDPGDATVESIPTGTRAAVLGGIRTVFDMPNTSPSITGADTLAWKQDYVERVAWCDMGLYVGATKTNVNVLPTLETARGVCGIKVFAGSSTGDLLVEDDESLERVMRAGRRRIAYHSEDEFRLQARKSMFRAGDPYADTWNGATRNAPFSALAAFWPSPAPPAAPRTSCTSRRPKNSITSRTTRTSRRRKFW